MFHCLPSHSGWKTSFSRKPLFVTGLARWYAATKARSSVVGPIYGLGQATTDHGFLAGYALAKPQLNLGFLEKSRFQAEWDGKQWNSVLRLQISADLPSVALKANVYAVGK